MMVLSHRALLAVAAVTDIAMHARPLPVAAKSLAARLELPPRHLETLLQALVRAQILKGLRGPRGGYELARERRKITAAAILQAVLSESAQENGQTTDSRLVSDVVAPMIDAAGTAFMQQLETITVEDICNRAERLRINEDTAPGSDFAI